MGKITEERQSYSDERFEELKRGLVDASRICGEKACIYATGSFGRREASPTSDIDLFIVSIGTDKNDRNWLSRLDEILIKADLISATQKLGFPPFSGDGRFLQHHTAHKLIATTGTEEDDATNTFTARLLLLLESRPLIGEKVHATVINDVIAKYWREFPDHVDRFMPTYLANDILRYWRTLCLNYEARTSERTPTDRAERKLANYKLKHSRMLTCYSALLFLLQKYKANRTVSVTDAQLMVRLTPTARINHVATHSSNARLVDVSKTLLDLYEKFLTMASQPREALIPEFSDEHKRKLLREEQSRFGDLVYEALHAIGENDRFYRRLVV